VAAQSALGTKYLRGEGVRQDYSEAIRWYRKAADQGYTKGEFNLGYVYARGYGVSQDYAQAARWYRKAADQGDAYAQYNLGLLYSQGQGVPQDSGEADRWFQKAADQGDEYAKRPLGRENTRPSAVSNLLPWVILVGSLVLLTGDSKRVWGFQNWRKSTVPMSIGILGVLYAGLSFYEIAKNPIRNSLYSANAFYFAKGALIGMSCVLALSVSARNFDPEEPESCVGDVEATETTEEDEKSDSF
jgi:TPR repeat protein